MCLNPKWIYKKGFYKQDNYRGIEGQFYELGTYSKCGCCSQCIAEKSNNWVIRNYYEERAHKKKCFITLTYENDPIILHRKDFQDFVKRFRTYLMRTTGRKAKVLKIGKNGEKKYIWKWLNFQKIRIFEAGEYGSRTLRPHGHIIIYGWKDSQAEYLDISKRGNIVYQSKIIQKIWGLGRTSYQSFNTKEAPYIALYNSPKETFKKAYKMNASKIKSLKRYAENHPKMDKKQRKNLINELNELEKELITSKAKYMLIKEFNAWSLALGWKEFEKEYYSEKIHDWKVYIGESQFVIPSPWVKKLANMGDIEAAEEMFRREREIEQAANEEEERLKNLNKTSERRKKEREGWTDKKDQYEF